MEGFCLSQVAAQTRPEVDGSEREILLPTMDLVFAGALGESNGSGV
jgi:hypothetical protein